MGRGAPAPAGHWARTLAGRPPRAGPSRLTWSAAHAGSPPPPAVGQQCQLPARGPRRQPGQGGGVPEGRRGHQHLQPGRCPGLTCGRLHGPGRVSCGGPRPGQALLAPPLQTGMEKGEVTLTPLPLVSTCGSEREAEATAEVTCVKFTPTGL